MTSVLIRHRGEGHVKTAAETVAMRPPAKAHLELAEAQSSPPEPSEGAQPWATSIQTSGFQNCARINLPCLGFSGGLEGTGPVKDIPCAQRVQSMPGMLAVIRSIPYYLDPGPQPLSPLRAGPPSSCFPVPDSMSQGPPRPTQAQDSRRNRS